MAREYANDVIYSAVLRPQIRQALPESQLGTPQAAAEVQRLAQNNFPLQLGQTYQLTDASFPWGRSFEWQFDLKPQP